MRVDLRFGNGWTNGDALAAGPAHDSLSDRSTRSVHWVRYVTELIHATNATTKKTTPPIAARIAPPSTEPALGPTAVRDSVR